MGGGGVGGRRAGVGEQVPEWGQGVGARMGAGEWCQNGGRGQNGAGEWGSGGQMGDKGSDGVTKQH